MDTKETKVFEWCVETRTYREKLFYRKDGILHNYITGQPYERY